MLYRFSLFVCLKTLIINGAGLTGGTVCSINSHDVTGHRRNVELTEIPVSVGANLSPGETVVYMVFK